MATIMDSIAEYNPDDDDKRAEAIAINQQYADMYLKHCATERSIAKESYKSYRKWLDRFLGYLKEYKPSVTFLTITKKDILDYKYYNEKTNGRSSSASLWMSAVRMILSWMEENQYIENNPYPRSLVIKAKAPMNILIPTPQQIFHIRRKVGVRIEQAAAFELLISTGIRHGELRQIRASDIDWNDTPIDVETGKPSEYFTASLKVSRSRMVLKSLEHKTWLSRPAVKMMKLFLAKAGIHPQSDTPLFPYGHTSIQKWLIQLGAGTITTEDNLSTPGMAPLKIPGQDIVVIGDGAIDEMAGLSEKHKQQLRTAKARMERSNAEIPKEILAREQRQVKPDDHKYLHPHCCRHFCICWMYYKNYLGERKNEVRLPRFFGHSRMATTMQNYLINLDAIKNDKEWIQLAKGHPFDWMAAK